MDSVKQIVRENSMLNFIISFFIFYCTFFFNILYYKIQDLSILNFYWYYIGFYDKTFFSLMRLRLSIYIYMLILLKILFFFIFYFQYIFYIFIIFFNYIMFTFINIKIINYILYFWNRHLSIVSKLKLFNVNKYSELILKKKEFEYYVIMLGDINYFYKKYNSEITHVDYIYGYFDLKLIEQYFLCNIFFPIFYFKSIYNIWYKWFYYGFLLLDTKITQIYLIVHRNEKYTIKFIFKNLKNKFYTMLLQFFRSNIAYIKKKIKKKYFLKKRISYWYSKVKRIILFIFFFIINHIISFFNYINYLFGTYILNPIFLFYLKNGGNSIVYFSFWILKYIKSFFVFSYKYFCKKIKNKKK